MAEKPVCKECGSPDHLLFDAYVAWDVERQDWVVVNVFEKPVICESDKCEGSETSVEWREIEGD